jgi:hypothetical protein
MSAIVQGVRNFGPYMLVELVLPGGTLIALTMWLLARWRRKESGRVRQNPV